MSSFISFLTAGGYRRGKVVWVKKRLNERYEGIPGMELMKKQEKQMKLIQ